MDYQRWDFIWNVLYLREWIMSKDDLWSWVESHDAEVAEVGQCQVKNNCEGHIILQVSPSDQCQQKKQSEKKGQNVQGFKCDSKYQCPAHASVRSKLPISIWNSACDCPRCVSAPGIRSILTTQLQLVRIACLLGHYMYYFSREREYTHLLGPLKIISTVTMR